MLVCGHGGMGGCVQRPWMTHVCVCVSCKSLNSPLKSISATLHLQLKRPGRPAWIQKNKINITEEGRQSGRREKAAVVKQQQKKRKKSESKLNRISRNQTEWHEKGERAGSNWTGETERHAPSPPLERPGWTGFVPRRTGPVFCSAMGKNLAETLMK